MHIHSLFHIYHNAIAKNNNNKLVWWDSFLAQYLWWQWNYMRDVYCTFVYPIAFNDVYSSILWYAIAINASLTVSISNCCLWWIKITFNLILFIVFASTIGHLQNQFETHKNKILNTINYSSFNCSECRCLPPTPTSHILVHDLFLKSTTIKIENSM